MFKTTLRALLAGLFLCCGVAIGAIVSSLPYTLQNGTTADASQAMANFNQILNNVNANAAKNGINSDITSLTALTGPSPGLGSLAFSGTSAATGANTIVLAGTLPTAYSLRQGNTVRFIAGSAPAAGATTLAVAGTTATALLKPSASGLINLTGNEYQAGQVVDVYYDGTQYELTTPSLAQYVPAGAVASFNLSACPFGWIPSDGTSSTVDMRGYFVRGLDTGGSIDPSRTLGSLQADSVGPHTHTIGLVYGVIPGGGTSVNGGNAGTSPTTGQTPSGTTETRVKNKALLYCQKT